MKKDPYLAGLAREDLLDLLGHMWIYTHGLTVLTSANPAVSESFIHDALEKMGHIVVMNKLIEKGVIGHEDSSD